MSEDFKRVNFNVTEKQKKFIDTLCLEHEQKQPQLFRNILGIFMESYPLMLQEMNKVSAKVLFNTDLVPESVQSNNISDTKVVKTTDNCIKECKHCKQLKKELVELNKYIDKPDFDAIQKLGLIELQLRKSNVRLPDSVIEILNDYRKWDK